MAHTNDTDERHAPEHASEAERLLVELLYGEVEDDDRESAEATVRAVGTLDTELDDLAEMRSLFRALPDEEPPAAVTAKLLHAAAVHAPSQPARASAKEADDEGGLWARLRAWFQPIVAYPGLAAAASLVVVIGLGTVLYLSTDNLMSHKEVSSASSAAPVGANEMADEAADRAAVAAPVGASADMPGAGVAADPAAAEAEPAEQAVDGAAAGDTGGALGASRAPTTGSGFGGAGIATRDNNSDKANSARPSSQREGRRASRSRGAGSVRLDLEQDDAPVASPVADDEAEDDDSDDRAGPRGGDGAGRGSAARPTTPTAAKGKSEAVIEVTTQEPELKDLPEEEKSAPKRPAPAKAPKRQAPAKPRPAPEPAPEPAPPPVTKKPAQSQTSRVRSLHAEAVIAAKNGQCDVVADIGSKIRRQDPKYYAATFQTDTRLGACRKPPAPTKK